ncbi:hypothetical protein [Bradyrhizobium sp. CCGB01]|uniref:hypothetical protein n=1 Tax=Bradyrhizobium sp. CCGB01 TaxID=2949634 RepID=UPI0020B3F08D|nr:hypothetical protein [Bradyrhizobium sp. CCGB01]MCP3407372.1 hypothetical protein [Bradyrhizobium sp. CCGB01]
MPQSRCATGDAAAGSSSPTNVHAIEFLKIGALQHHYLGHRPQPVEDYLKPKVFPAGPSTRVTALSEKNVVAYNSIRVRHFLDLFVPQKGRRRRCTRGPPVGVAVPI